MVLLIILFALLVTRLSGERPQVKVFPGPRLPEEWTWRPEVDDAIRHLTTDVSPGVGFHGAGGYGKTSLARAIGMDRRIRAHFKGGVVWVEVGQPRGRNGAEVLVSIHPPEEDGSLQNGSQLSGVEHLIGSIGELLENRGRVLVMVDDVWNESQLEPFLALGEKVRLLVTTQVPRVLPRRMRRIPIGALPSDVAKKMLSREFPKLSHELRDKLLDSTHRWPQLLGLVIRRLATDVERGANVNRAARKVIDQFADAGVTAWDINNSGMRTTAVKATIEYSLAVVSKDARTRFLELGIFAPDVDVPLEMAAKLWHVTAGLTPAESERLCDELTDLSLLTLRWIEDRPVITLSRTIRLFSLSASVLGKEQRIQLNRSFVDASRDALTEPNSTGTSWWSLPPEHFLWDQLAYHLAEAERQTELTGLVTNLEWVLARLDRSGPWAMESDLGFSTAEEAAEILPLIARVGHLFGDLGDGEVTRGNRRTHLSALSRFREQVERTAAADRPDLVPLLPIPESRDSDSIRTLPAHHDAVTAVAIMDGGRLVTGCRDGTVYVWDIDKGTPIRKFKEHTAAVTAIARAPEGTLLATASADRSIILWNWEEGTASAVCSGHTDSVTAVAIAADGTWIASSSEDGTVRGWDMNGGQRGAIKVDAGWVNAVAILPDSTWFATASMDGKVRLWHTNGTSMVELATHDQAATALAVSPDGKKIVSGSRDATLRVSDTEGSKSRVLSGHTDIVNAVAVSPDGTWAASASEDDTVRMWYPTEGTAGRVFRGHTEAVTALAISPDGTRLASASGRTVCIWDTTATAGVTAGEHIGAVFGVSAAPDGTWLASGSDDGTVRLWDVTDGRQVALLEGHDQAVTSVAVARDGTWLASASRDRTVRLWQVGGDREPLVLNGHTRSVNAIAIAPNGTWLVSAADDVHVRMWDAGRGTELRRMTGYNGWVQAVAVAPDGDWLASAYMQGQGVRLWNTDGTLKGNVLGQHTGVVTAIAIAQDGSCLAAAFLQDHSVQFWNADGVIRRPLTGHSDRIQAVAISPDGAWLATASEDRTIRLWTMGEDAHCVAVVRCGGAMYDISWGSSRMLVAGGARGLYAFTLSGAGDRRSGP
ncbi:NB-ARC domain-containing protein [Herbidospora mongoliensis]|uniref:NB-ARC domain-containing protein n=1 Tax=Herbidospora mongoliensis TaxID=688067 RepID=UPI001470AE5F|nr:NB-ARC domain-containing protein [Herbidospora mongoliensis]